MALSHVLFNWLSYSPQDHLPRYGIVHSGLGPPSSSVGQENTHTLVYTPI